MDEKTIIKKIADYCIKVYPKKKILPSLVIAQCILETGHFKSGLFLNAYNLTGMKWVAGCGCDAITMPTKEWNGKCYITINAKFRKYKTLEDGIEGHYKFLEYPRYSNLKGVTDYVTACKLVQQDGWATSPTYTANLINVIKTYKLYEYDNQILQPTKKKSKAGSKGCYNKCSVHHVSIVSALKSVGEKDTSFTHRKKIAKANGIKLYVGTAKQNVKLLTLLKKGNLKKA